MKFVIAQLIGIVGDQFEWWGQQLQARARKGTREAIGAEVGDDFPTLMWKLSAHLDGPPVAPTETTEETT